MLFYLLFHLKKFLNKENIRIRLKLKKKLYIIKVNIIYTKEILPYFFIYLIYILI